MRYICEQQCRLQRLAAKQATIYLHSLLSSAESASVRPGKTSLGLQLGARLESITLSTSRRLYGYIVVNMLKIQNLVYWRYLGKTCRLA